MNSIFVTAPLLDSFIILLVITIVFNIRAGTKCRAILVTRPEQLRLVKILTLPGIDTDHNCHANALSRYASTGRACTACNNARDCDNRLQQDKLGTDAIDFCNKRSIVAEIIPKNRGFCLDGRAAPLTINRQTPLRIA